MVLRMRCHCLSTSTHDHQVKGRYGDQQWIAYKQTLLAVITKRKKNIFYQKAFLAILQLADLIKMRIIFKLTT